MQDWFDAEINEEIERRDKSLAKFKESRLHSDKESYKKACNKVQRMIKNKKKNFFTGKLNENIGKPKEFWKSLKSLGLLSRKSSCSTICLEKDGILSFDPKANAEIFKDFYSNLANDLVKMLPNPPNKYGKDAVKKYYENLNLVGKSFSFEPVAHTSVLKHLQQLNPHKSAGIDNLTGKFLKEGAPVLASPITNLINLSISLSSFPDDCKIAKLKPRYKKEAKTKPKNYRPISLLPLISKIIERIIHDQTQVFLDENKILFTYQSGFRKHYSTYTCLSYLADRVRNGFEKGSLTGMILIDLPNPPNKYGKDAVKKYYKNLNLVGKSFSFEPVAHTSVLKHLQQLNPHKSAGIDNLTGKFLKEGAPVLASPITNLINLSISLSSFPDDCKIAKLKPRYKKEAKTKPKNYRPISLLPLISKIIERIIHDQTQVFLDENKILFTYQSGFRKHYSTYTCLSYLADRVRNGFEKGSLTGMILIDLQKAFDTIDHKILTEKMSCLGFAESTVRWYKSYITKRCFIVNVGNDFSSPGKLCVVFLKGPY